MSLDVDRSAWKRVSFGEVADRVRSQIERGDVDRYVAGGHFDDGSLEVTRWGNPDDGGMGSTFTYGFLPGHTLFVSASWYLRKIAVATFEGVVADKTYVLAPRDPSILDPRFLPFILLTDRFHEYAAMQATGSMNARLLWSALAKYEFDLPPLDQQRRIADLLWASEAVHRSRLELIRSLERLRLAYAQRLFDSTTSRTSVASLGVRSEQSVQVGPFGGSLASRHFTESGVPVLKINNLTAGGLLDTRSLVYVSEDHAQDLARYRVRAGDLLVAAQATVGRVAIVTEESASSLISQHLIRVRVDPTLLEPSLLLLLFQCPGVQRQMEAVKTKTTRDGLNTSDVASFDLPQLSPEQRSAALFELGKLESSRSALKSADAADDILKSAVLGILEGSAR